jgi:hypothetical protein
MLGRAQHYLTVSFTKEVRIDHMMAMLNQDGAVGAKSRSTVFPHMSGYK